MWGMMRRPRSIERIAKAWQPPTAKTRPRVVQTKTVSMLPEDLPSRYRFFISAIIPRPIALVSSINTVDGTPNLSPFSYFGLVNHDPGTVVVSFVEKGRNGGDTLTNILGDESPDSGFCVHLMSESFLAPANFTCGNFPPEVDEFKESGLTAVPSDFIKAPRCAEAMVALECRRVAVHPMTGADGKRSATMVIGEVIKIHVHDTVWDSEKGVIRHDVLRPMTRLGGNTYGCLGETFDLPRPRVS